MILELSKTYRMNATATGLCLKCYEPSDALNPCCGQGISFEGDNLYADDLISDIADELGLSEDEVINELN